MENSNGGDMSPLVNKESILTKEVKKKEVESFTTDEKKILIKKIFGEREKQNDVVIKDVLGKEVDKLKVPMTFIKKEDVEKAFLSKEEEEWIKQFSIISIPDEKEYNGFRHHHYKLANKISAMCERIKELEETVKVLRSIQSDWNFNFHKKCIKEISKQEEKTKYETRKLKKLKEKYSILGGIK